MAGRAPERDVVTLLAKALRKLGQAGEPEEALRLGGAAWWALKDENPDAAEHINGVMHYLAKLPPTETSSTKAATAVGPAEVANSDDADR